MQRLLPERSARTTPCVNLSYTQCHRKGGDDDRGRLPGEQHAQWLGWAAEWYHRETGWPVFVSITDWHGWDHVEMSPYSNERAYLWEVWSRPYVKFATTNANPGLQRGAALCIWLGLEAAFWSGYELIVQAAEDVLPESGLLRRMAVVLGEFDYVGLSNGEGLDCRFFGVRVGSLLRDFDPPDSRHYPDLETYLARHLSNHGRSVYTALGNYRHTHNFTEYRRWRE